MRNTFQLFLRRQLLLFALTFAIFPYHANSQSNIPSVTQDTLNVGYGIYTKGATRGTLNATWNYANVWSGKGTATGVSKDGFAGKYHIKYYYENGEFSDEYDLIIEKSGDGYKASWITNGKLSAVGVGMMVENGLAVGWRRVDD